MDNTSFRVFLLQSLLNGWYFLFAAVVGVFTNNCYLLIRFTSKHSFIKGWFFLLPSFCLETKGATYAGLWWPERAQNSRPIQNGYSLNP
jgi:hypothetical protein